MIVERIVYGINFYRSIHFFTLYMHRSLIKKYKKRNGYFRKKSTITLPKNYRHYLPNAKLAKLFPQLTQFPKKRKSHYNTSKRTFSLPVRQIPILFIEKQNKHTAYRTFLLHKRHTRILYIRFPMENPRACIPFLSISQLPIYISLPPRLLLMKKERSPLLTHPRAFARKRTESGREKERRRQATPEGHD